MDDGGTKTNDKPNEEKNSQEISKAEPDYVVVADGPDGEPIELPTNAEDNTLGLSTLQHTFPGAHGLKYKNPTTGAMRALLIDASGSKFYAPAGGWSEKRFVVIFQNEPAKRVMPSEQSSKRKKLMDDSVTSDSDGEGNGLHHGAQVTKLQRLNEEQALSNDRSVRSKQEYKSRDDEEAIPTDLIILGLPFTLEEQELKEYFEKHGDVDMVEIKRDGNGKSRGFGFVRMQTVADQNTILDTVHNIGGRRCHVKFPVLKSEVNDGGGRAPDNVRLFVGKLTDKVTPKRLREFFGAEARKIDPRAQVTDTYVPNPFRGFAFVTLSSVRVAKEFLKRDDYVIDDVAVTLSIAAPKQQLQPAAQQSSSQYSQPEYYAGPEKHHPYPDPWDQYPAPYGGAQYAAYESSRYDASSPYPPGSNSLTSGLETLNLNNMKPDVMDEALKAFWSVAKRQAPKSRGPADRAGRPELYAPGPMYPPRRNGPPYGPGASSPSHQWR